VKVHLVDGTYELFRYYFSPGASHLNDDGEEVGATRRILGSMLQLLEGGATHVGIATDHVIESFRNDLWAGYKNGDGIEADLAAQFHPAEDALRAAGFCVWPMIDHEADDAMAAAAQVAASDERVEEVLICTPDKDLAQCVDDDRHITQWDRRRDLHYDRAGVIEKFGVEPVSIPDYLGLVGDTADGFPGVKGWGAKSAAAVLFRWGHISDIPDVLEDWDVTVRGGPRLLTNLAAARDDALLFRRLATLDLDAPTIDSVDELEWRGPTVEFASVCERVDAAGLVERAARLVEARGG
jgi:5'-3' exonuclease